MPSNNDVETTLTTLAEVFDKIGDERVFTGTDIADALRAIVAKVHTFRKPVERPSSGAD
jgi:hypothetical protein